jgi:hypothetical protein
MAITKIQSESLNLADTYDFTGTVTGAGGVNTPNFFADGVSSSQALPNETFTTLTNWNTPTKSAQGTFSSGIYTPGIAGRYLFYTMVDIGNMADSDRVFCLIEASEDGSSWTTKGSLGKDMCSSANADIAPQTSVIIDCTANTQIRVQCWQGFGANRNHQGGFFGGYKLIT